jgi:hypothetical protein
MLTEVRTAVKKTTTFVKEHRTLTACAVTAVVASKMTYTLAINSNRVADVAELGFNLGYRACAHEYDLHHLTHLEFLDHNGLTEKFAEFAAQNS